MKGIEVFDLLAIINSFLPSFDHKDERKLMAWKRVLGDALTYEEAERYLYEHFESSRFAPLPSDLLKRKPRTIDPFTITEEEREHLGDIYRKQCERNASQRGVIRAFPQGPDTPPGKLSPSDS